VIVRIVQRYPFLIIGLTLSLLIFSLYSAQHVVYEYKIDTFFSKDDVIYRQYKLFTKDFRVGSENIFIFVKSEDVTNREVLEYMLKLEKELRHLKYVENIVSPASILVSIYGKLPEDPVVIRETLKRYGGDLIPTDTLALISISISATESQQRNELAKQIEDIVKFSPKPAGVHVSVTGSPVMGYQIMKSIQKSVRLTTSASAILMVVILFLVFSGVVRRKIFALVPLLISILSVIFVYGAMPILGIPMTEVTNGFMPILIGLAIEYAAQLQSRFEEERKEGKRTDESIGIAIRSTGLAIALAMLTTVIGFLSMLFSGVPALGWFGILSALGLIVAFILTLTFLPALLKITDRDVKVEVSEEDGTGILERSLSVLAKVTAKRFRTILILTLVVIAFGFYGYTQIKLETNPRNYVPQDLPAIVSLKELERLVGGQHYYVVILNVDRLDLNAIKRADELGRYIAQRESYVDNYESLAKAIVEFYGRMPSNDIKLEMVLQKLPPYIRDKFISGNQIAIYIASHVKSFDEEEKLYYSIQNDVRYFGWKDGFYVSGYTPLLMEMGRLMLLGQSKMTIAAYILIVALMFLVYRSITKAVVPLVSITTVIAIVNAFMFVFGIKQTMLSTTMNSMVLGLGIDFSIHVLERYLEERKSYDPMMSVMRTVERTGKAITTSALTMAGGFGALLISPFPLMQTFGVLSLVAIIFSLLASLTVVPAFLMITEMFKPKLGTPSPRGVENV